MPISASKRIAATLLLKRRYGFLWETVLIFVQRNQIDFVERTQQQIAEAMKVKSYSDALQLIARVIECVHRLSH